MNILCWPTLAAFLSVSTRNFDGAQAPRLNPPLSANLTGQQILDIACGNGLTSRRLGALGAQVIAFDFSANLIEKLKPAPPISSLQFSNLGFLSTSSMQLMNNNYFPSANKPSMPRSPIWPFSIWPIWSRFFVPCPNC